MKKSNKAEKWLSKHKKYVFLGIGFVMFYVVLFFIFRKYQVSQEDIRKVVEPFGLWGIFALLGVQIVFSLTPMPDGAMPMLAYLLYGPAGLLVIMVGMYIAAVMHYYIGKRLGKPFIVKRFPLVTKFLEKLNHKHTTIKLIYMRLFTLVSFDITSYVAGIANIDFKTFSTATILGLIPTNVTLMVISSGLFASTAKDAVLIWGCAILLISILAYLYKQSTIKAD